MDNHQEKIQKFSKVIYIFLQIAFVSLIVAGALLALTWIAQIANLNTTIVEIGGRNVEVPILFQVGEFRVVMPVIFKDGTDFLASGFLNTVLPFGEDAVLEYLLSVIVELVAVAFAKKVFKSLRENGSPFREDVVRGLKRMSVALLVVGAFGGLTGFLAAGVVWVLCLIFDYGRRLQNESDTTL